MQIKNTTIKYLFFAGLFVTLFVFNFKVFAFQDYFANWFEKPNEYSINNNVSFPINTGNSFQTKNGALVIHGIRVLGPAVFDQGFKLANGAAQGRVLTSDADGNVSWQQFQGGGGGEVVWGDITGTLSNQTDLNNRFNTLNGLLNLRAPLNSPVFVNPRAPTPLLGDDDTSIATTAFVHSAKNEFLSNSGTWNDLGDVVRLSNLTHNVSIGSTSILFKVSATAVNRFIHTGGVDNLFMGRGVGVAATFGQANTVIGSSSLDSPSFNGNDNVGLGVDVLGGSSPSRNVAIGFSSRATANASSETAIGYGTLGSSSIGINYALGYGVLSQVTTGTGNASIGGQGIGSSITGSNNTLIGYGTTLSAGNLSNASAIGYGATVQASNRMVFGQAPATGTHTLGWGFGTQPVAGQDAVRVGTSTSNGNGARLTLAGVWTNASDLNKKTNIQNLNYGLKEVLQLRPVSFNWKDSNQHDIGFIAQEVKQIIPELVYGQEGDLSLAYSQLPVVLVNAVNEQNETLNQDKINFDNFEIELYELEKKIKNAN